MYNKNRLINDFKVQTKTTIWKHMELMAANYFVYSTHLKGLAPYLQNYDIYIYAFNKNYYLIARKGDTFRSIAKEVDVSYRKLAKYNERNKNDKLEEGEIVWLKKKRSKAPKDYKGRSHYVKSGESMYSISQRYGIRLKKLYKINNIPPDYQIRVGEAIRLR
jgi:LysM repeat protein